MSITPASTTSPTTRARWVRLLCKISRPPLASLARGQLRATMPVEARPGHADSRVRVTHLEALGRTLAGLAPWLELADVAEPSEAAVQAEFHDLARAALVQALDPDSPDCLDFTEDGQALVDAAFLAHALLRAPQTLFAALPPITQERLLAGLRSTRAIKPWFNNWLLFSAMVEAALLRFSGKADLLRIDYAVRQHEQWYKGDGAYGDGPNFHWDYYNSFVIQPMLLDVLATVAKHTDAWQGLLPAMQERARRYAAVLERLIAPDGSFPPIGRSLAYRCGAFQHLAQMALCHDLPENLAPAQVRCALDAAIRRTLEAPGTFDDRGWLRIGLCGSQPDLAEDYISTGSLYLCSTAFLPLGLSAGDPFWNTPDTPWTSAAIWRGENLPADHALH
ncbi:MAG: DUF2264 domain-containing protein [Opitutaceae bacterium]|jgi:hypothetical protein